MAAIASARYERYETSTLSSFADVYPPRRGRSWLTPGQEFIAAVLHLLRVEAQRLFFAIRARAELGRDIPAQVVEQVRQEPLRQAIGFHVFGKLERTECELAALERNNRHVRTGLLGRGTVRNRNTRRDYVSILPIHQAGTR